MRGLEVRDIVSKSLVGLAATSMRAAKALSGTEATFVSPHRGPSRAEVERLYNEADLERAIQAYKFFYPTVSGAAIVRGNRAVGLVPNQVFGILDSKPHHVGFTYNSDTPYGPVLLDLRAGPIVIELPAGPLIVVAMDVHQRWVADMGIPGPDQGRGGKHLILPPGFEGEIPSGYQVWPSSSNMVILGIRSLPVRGDVAAAKELIRTVKVFPLAGKLDKGASPWLDLTGTPHDTTPLKWETHLAFWRVLHEVLQEEPPFDGYRDNYGELAALGIAKGKPFAPDARMERILERAAKSANAQMRVQSFADRRPDRVVWPDRQWEWLGLQPSSGDFAAPNYTDLEAREVWFYQAIGASPAMFGRAPGSGSLYWLSLRDETGTYLDGANTYKLVVPQPVPAKLFWSVTVYDVATRSQIATSQGKAALRSLFELQDATAEGKLELFFGPQAPRGTEPRWIQTIPKKGWFAYFRLYGPGAPAFDGTWKPGDFERVAR